MEKNHQPDQQFLQEFGALLAARTGQGRTLPPSLTHLAEHVMSARRFQKLTRAALAQKVGKTEAEIYALEHSLLSYAELDLHFLSLLATALDEELETLVLLLGRPTVVQALQMQDTRKKHEYPQSLSCQPKSNANTTASKQYGNLFQTKQWLNALCEGYLDLIDSLQQGRLSSIINVKYWLHPVVAVFVSLFIIWVGTYSLTGSFGAQSALQASIVAPSSGDSLLPTYSDNPTYDDGAFHATLALADQHSATQVHKRLYLPPEVGTQIMTTALAAPSTALAFSIVIETQQCDTRTIGRFALCRV